MKPRILLIVIALLAVTALLVWQFQPAGNQPKAGAPPAKPMPGSGSPLAVVGMVVQPRAYTESVTLTGSIVANEAVVIRPEVSGRIVALGFTEGQRVVKGQMLVRLFDADLRARLTQVLAQVALDSSQVERLQRLRAVDGISAEEFQRAAATLEMHRAQADEIRAQLEKTTITAPFAGRVGLRNASVGAVVGPASEITLLRDDSQLKVECTVPEKYATAITVGTQMTFTVRGSRNATLYRARVYAVDPELNPESRTLRIRALIAQPTGLLPGMFADVTVQLATVPDALLVHTESVVVDLNGPKVFVANGDVAREVRITTGTRTTTDVRVLDGLAPGDTVLTTGMLVMKDGLPIGVSVVESVR